MHIFSDGLVFTCMPIDITEFILIKSLLVQEEYNQQCVITVTIKQYGQLNFGSRQYNDAIINNGLIDVVNYNIFKNNSMSLSLMHTYMRIRLQFSVWSNLVHAFKRDITPHRYVCLQYTCILAKDKTLIDYANGNMHLNETCILI